MCWSTKVVLLDLKSAGLLSAHFALYAVQMLTPMSTLFQRLLYMLSNYAWRTKFPQKFGRDSYPDQLRGSFPHLVWIPKITASTGREPLG